MTAPFPFPYTIVVSEGIGMPTVHPQRLSPAHRATIEAILAGLHLEPSTPALSIPARVSAPASASMMTQREIATASGYTGDTCTTCGSFAMRRGGTCLTCTSCGTTTGCG